MRTRRNNDRILLESLVRKYGKSSVKTAIRRINESINGDFEIRNDVLVKYRGNGGKVVIPDNVTEIGERAFGDCTALTSVNIPDSVTSIGRLAFFECDSLTSVTIPDSVTKIGYGAFAGCTSLTSVTIPDSVTKIGDCAFNWCTSLTSIAIPDSVTSIGERAIAGCKSLTSVTIPDSVTSIGYGAFWDCTSLTSVIIGDSVTEIGGRAFCDCTSLANINIPKGVRVGKDAFKGTKIKNKKKRKPLTSEQIDDIVSAAVSVFSDWENDEDGWDEPFNAYKELSNNNFADILDYYNGWNDFYDYLDMSEDEFNELYDEMSDRNLKMINKRILNAF